MYLIKVGVLSPLIKILENNKTECNHKVIEILKVLLTFVELTFKVDNKEDKKDSRMSVDDIILGLSSKEEKIKIEASKACKERLSECFNDNDDD